MPWEPLPRLRSKTTRAPVLRPNLRTRRMNRCPFTVHTFARPGAEFKRGIERQRTNMRGLDVGADGDSSVTGSVDRPGHIHGLLPDRRAVLAEEAQIPGGAEQEPLAAGGDRQASRFFVDLPAAEEDIVAADISIAARCLDRFPIRLPGHGIGLPIVPECSGQGKVPARHELDGAERGIVDVNRTPSCEPGLRCQEGTQGDAIHSPRRGRGWLDDASERRPRSLLLDGCGVMGRRSRRRPGPRGSHRGTGSESGIDRGAAPVRSWQP